MWLWLILGSLVVVDLGLFLSGSPFSSSGRAFESRFCRFTALFAPSLPPFFLYLQHELSHEIYNCHWRDSERTCALLRATSRTFRMASAQHGA